MLLLLFKKYQKRSLVLILYITTSSVINITSREPSARNAWKKFCFVFIYEESARNFRVHLYGIESSGFFVLLFTTAMAKWSRCFVHESIISALNHHRWHLRQARVLLLFRRCCRSCICQLGHNFKHPF